MPSLAAHVGYDTVETLQSTATSTVKAHKVCVAVERGDLCSTAVLSTCGWAAAATWHVSMTKQMQVGPANC